MKKYLLVLLFLVLTLSGVILMKLGGNAGTMSIESGNLSFSFNIVSLVGLICYILSFLVYTSIIVKFDLSYISPVTSGITQLGSLIAGIILFNENISIKSIIGIGLIIIGIIIMNIKKPNKAQV